MNQLKAYIAVLLFTTAGFLFSIRAAFARIHDLESVSRSQQELLFSQQALIKKLVQSNNDMGAAVNKLEVDVVRHSDFPKMDPRDIIPPGGKVITVP